MKTLDEINRLLAEREKELARLDARRIDLVRQIAELRQERASFLDVPESPLPPGKLGGVTNRSPQEAKIGLFRSLFRGREDVYAKRFESLKTGKTGYQPACRNEWASGVCEKPRMRCDRCTHREFLPLTDQIVW
jgi:hypothetical protein